MARICCRRTGKGGVLWTEKYGRWPSKKLSSGRLDLPHTSLRPRKPPDHCHQNPSIPAIDCTSSCCPAQQHERRTAGRERIPRHWLDATVSVVCGPIKASFPFISLFLLPLEHQWRVALISRPFEAISHMAATLVSSPHANLAPTGSYSPRV